jgi:hypothetical protein
VHVQHIRDKLAAVAGTKGFTTMTLGTRMKLATGAISRMKLKLRLS